MLQLLCAQAYRVTVCVSSPLRLFLHLDGYLERLRSRIEFSYEEIERYNRLDVAGSQLIADRERKKVVYRNDAAQLSRSA